MEGKKRQIQDAVVSFIRALLFLAMIKIVWSHLVYILSFVFWLKFVQLIKSIFQFHLFSICTLLLYRFTLAVHICLLDT